MNTIKVVRPSARCAEDVGILCAEITSSGVKMCGFDTETTIPRNYKSKTTVVQICILAKMDRVKYDSDTIVIKSVPNHINKRDITSYIFPIKHLYGVCGSRLPECLTKIIVGAGIIKIGCGLVQDAAELRRSYNLSMNHMIDLQCLMKSFGQIFCSLDNLSLTYLDTPKGEKILGNYDGDLSDAQIIYGANDAYLPLEIYLKMVNEPLSHPINTNSTIKVINSDAPTNQKRVNEPLNTTINTTPATKINNYDAPTPSSRPYDNKKRISTSGKQNAQHTPIANSNITSTPISNSNTSSTRPIKYSDSYEAAYYDNTYDVDDDDFAVSDHPVGTPSEKFVLGIKHVVEIPEIELIDDELTKIYDNIRKTSFFNCKKGFTMDKIKNMIINEQIINMYKPELRTKLINKAIQRLVDEKKIYYDAYLKVYSPISNPVTVWDRVYYLCKQNIPPTGVNRSALIISLNNCLPGLKIEIEKLLAYFIEDHRIVEVEGKLRMA